MASASFPALNIGSTPAAIEIQALVPGIDPAALQITVDRGLLTIAGERKTEVPDNENTNVYARERFAGSFRRVLSLPEDADPAQVEARYRDGILRVSVKRRESSQSRRIALVLAVLWAESLPSIALGLVAIGATGDRLCLFAAVFARGRYSHELRTKTRSHQFMAATPPGFMLIQSCGSANLMM